MPEARTAAVPSPQPRPPTSGPIGSSLVAPPKRPRKAVIKQLQPASRHPTSTPNSRQGASARRVLSTMPVSLAYNLPSLALELRPGSNPRLAHSHKLSASLLTRPVDDPHTNTTGLQLRLQRLRTGPPAGRQLPALPAPHKAPGSRLPASLPGPSLTGERVARPELGELRHPGRGARAVPRQHLLSQL